MSETVPCQVFFGGFVPVRKDRALFRGGIAMFPDILWPEADHLQCQSAPHRSSSCPSSRPSTVTGHGSRRSQPARRDDDWSGSVCRSRASSHSSWPGRGHWSRLRRPRAEIPQNNLLAVSQFQILDHDIFRCNPTLSFLATTV